MQKLYVIGLVLCFSALALFPNDAFASHSQGADLTYECLGGNQYQITLKFYRDCEGISAPSAPTISISSASCGESLSLTLQPIPGTGQEVSPICQNDATECTNGNLPGVQEYVYRGIITLPAQCDDWTLAYSLCCRNAAINTISSPDNQDIYVESILDNLNYPCNSSPVFSNKPVPFVCVGELFCFNHGAIDPDGDSLVYSLVTPMNGPGSTVNYTGGYTASQPLASNPPVFFDNATGDICMTPQQIQVTVVAVLVEEYRNGVKIGSVTRDIQIRVIQCTNETPYLDGMDLTGSGVGNGQYQTSVCAGTEICFDIHSYDDDQQQNVTLSWNQGISGGTFDPGTGSRPTANFCWTPTQNDISTAPHCFTVLVQDDNCPYFGTSVYSFCITVTGLTTDAGPDQSISCVNQTDITATVNGGSGNYDYTWNTGETTPTITVPEGTYWVDIDDGQGCIGSDTVEVTYIDDPVAGFTYDAVCLNQTSSFADTSIAQGGSNLVSWQWDFGDNSGTSTDQNPTYTYDNFGDYDVELVVENNLGCHDTIVETVTVEPAPDADFSFVEECEDEALTFTDESTIGGGVTVNGWSWDFGDNSAADQNQSTTHQYSAAGCYDVILSVTADNNCTARDTQEVCAHPLPVADFDPTDVCFNTATEFSDESTVSTGTITGWEWDFAGNATSTDENPTHTFQSDGTFDVTLVATTDNSCTDTITQPVTVRALPSAGFAFDTVCAVSSTSFTDTSSINSGNIVDYYWDFDDQSNSTLQDPNHAYDTGGVYNVELLVTSDYGCQDSITQAVLVHHNPFADFDFTNVCNDQINAFTDASSVNVGNISEWLWGFGDPLGSGAISQDTAFEYPSPGSYQVNLSVTTNFGCSDDTTQTVRVYDNPEADFTITDECQKFAPTITDLSTIAAGSIDQWIWDYDDGDSAFVQSPPDHYYSSAGNYDVTLIVVSDNNCSDTITQPLEIYPMPVADFDFSDVCLGEDAQFTDQSSINGGSILGRLYDFGDGPPAGTSVIPNPTYNYGSDNTYDVNLEVTSNYGCVHDTTKTITVYPIPEPDFTYDDVCFGEVTPFTDESSIASGSLSAWDWTFNDNNATSTDQDATHTFSTAGSFNVNLEVTSDFGCTNDVTLPVVVHPLPQINFTSDNTEGCQPLTVNFSDLSVIGGGYNVSQWIWDFGDGTDISTEENPTHTYEDYGVYTVSLTVKSDEGCTSELVNNNMISVYPKPYAAFGAAPQPTSVIYPFVDFSDQSSEDVEAWSWNYNDGSTLDSIQNPSYEFPAVGSFPVELIVTNQYECMDTTVNIIVIDPAHTFYIPSAFTPNGDGNNEVFFGDGTGIENYQMRIFTRWGELIYHSGDTEKKWDGRHMKTGAEVKPDVYVYRFDIIDVFGDSHVYRGRVSLVR